MCTNNISFVTKVWLSCHLHDKSEEGEHEDDPGQHGSWGWRSTRCILTASSRVRSGTRRTGRNSWWPGPIQARGLALAYLCIRVRLERKICFFNERKSFLFFCYFLSSSGPGLFQSIQIQSFHSYTTGCPKKRVNSISGNFLSKEHKNSQFFWKNGR